MTPNGYLLAITAPEPDTRLGRSVFDSVPTASLLFSAATGGRSSQLYLLPAVGPLPTALHDQLRADRLLTATELKPFSLPLQEQDLAMIREAFNNVGLDARDVPPNDLSGFLSSKIEGRYDYFIHVDHRQWESGMYRVEIKRLEDHPQFDPSWLQQAVSNPSSGEPNTSADGIDVVEQTLTLLSADDAPPPPPPR